jgi:hypothetical protein
MVINLKARFALSSSAVFTRSDTVTDSERFYNTVVDLLNDPDESYEVDQLLVWWTRYAFPAIPNVMVVSL